MKELRDPAIKLFGKEIALPEKGRNLSLSGEEYDGGFGDEDERSDTDRSLVMDACLEDQKVDGTGDDELEEEGTEPQADDKDPLEENPTGSNQQQDKSTPNTEEATNPETLPASDESSGEEEKTPNTETDQTDPDQKLLKKPDKILPCPRCNSMDTKFCYYNNYNVNQPRHFCRSCQRYWTAGGTMRNVPVGAGRRKNKNCRQVSISEALEAAAAASHGTHHAGTTRVFGANGRVLCFGPEAPLCESMASALNLAEPKKSPLGDDCSSGSSVTTSNSMEGGRGMRKNGVQEPNLWNNNNLNGFSAQIPCLPWPYPWNSAVPIPGFCPPPGYPIPVYPAPYWNCSVPGGWSVPWLAPNSPTTLGKHSREEDLTKSPEDKDSEIVIPKTLRIHDPDEAAKSSIWATLGIKNESIGKKGFFRAFQPKGEEKRQITETPPELWANPAAMSRSLSFQEGA